MVGQEHLKPTITITAEMLTGKAKTFVENWR